MNTQEPTKKSPSRWWLIAAFAGGLVIMGLIAVLLVNITTRKAEGEQYPLHIVEIADDELDPSVWGKNFPRHYDSFMKTQDSTISTPFGGSVPFDRLERFPAMTRIWAGYAFSKDHNEERGHYYMPVSYTHLDVYKRQSITLPMISARWPRWRGSRTCGRTTRPSPPP